jgi:hypothetical protein
MTVADVDAVAAHADAVMVLLASVNVVDGLAPPGTELPYISLYVHTPRDVGDRLVSRKPGRQTTVSAVCVGNTPWESRRMVGRVQSAFRDVRPTVSGFTTGPLFQITEGQPEPDQSTQLPPYSATEVWRFTSIPS